MLRRLGFCEQLLIHSAQLIQELQAPALHPECKARNEKAIKGLRTMQAMVASQLRDWRRKARLIPRW